MDTRPLVLASLIVTLSAFGAGTVAQNAEAPVAELTRTVVPLVATVGQQLAVTVVVTLGPDTTFEPTAFESELGPFTVLSGGWDPPADLEGGQRWNWSGTVSAYETGELELPELELTVGGPAGERVLRAGPISVTISSVLEEEDAEPMIADLKAPASLPPDFGVVKAALLAAGFLLLAALLAWWLHRRYAAKLQAAAVPSDPFHRISPEVWVYSELQKLLEERFPERGEIARFYQELAHILKAYLSGRYRVDLLEQTTFEVPASLRQAGAPDSPIDETTRVLDRCDQVKFAMGEPGPEDWKSVVEDVYRIVDRTKTAVAASRASAEAV